MIKDVIRLKWEAQLSHESIAAALGVSKGAVAKYLGLASAAGLDWETVREWDERQLVARLLPRAPALSPFVEPDWGRVHRELDRKGVTLMLLWEEYVAAHPHERTWRYTQFCEHYKAFAQRLKRSMRQHRRAGEKLFIDFAGPAVALRDGGRAQVFVAALGASSYTFACATGAQKLEDWVECMVRARLLWRRAAADRARQRACGHRRSESLRAARCRHRARPCPPLRHLGPAGQAPLAARQGVGFIVHLVRLVEQELAEAVVRRNGCRRL